MTPSEQLPAIDACIDLYTRLYDRHGRAAFDPESLSRRSADGDEEPPGDESLPRLLDLLVAYGLLDRTREGRYRVRCAPDERLDRWQARTATRVETLHGLVPRTTSGSPGRSPSGSGGGRETLRHAGDEFASVRVTGADDLDSVTIALREALAEAPSAVGVVLRSPGDLAADVQRLADELPSGVEVDDETWSFEKATTDLVGEDKDHLDFRLFLRETT